MKEQHIDHELEALFKGGEKSQKRIEGIMALVEKETEEKTYPIKKSRQIYKSKWLLAAVVTLCMLTPVNGMSFAGLMIEWVQETMISFQHGSLGAFQRHAEQSSDIRIRESEEREVQGLEDIEGTFGWQLSEIAIPESFYFDTGSMVVYEDEETRDFILTLKYETIEGEPTESPRFAFQISRKTLVLNDNTVDYELGLHVQSPDIESATIDFMGDEAMVIKGSKTYTIAAKPMIVEEGNEVVYTYLSVSYQNIEREEVWQNGLELLEALHRVVNIEQ